MIQTRLARIGHMLRTTAANSKLVQGEATMESLRRFRWVALATACFTVMVSWWLWRGAAVGTGSRAADALQTLIQIHLSMAAASAVLGLGAHALSRRQARASYTAVALQIIISATLLLYGGALSVLAQPQGANLTPFAVACLFNAMLSVGRPAISVPGYALTFAAIWFALPWVQTDPLQLGMDRLNALSAVLLSWFTSVAVWVQYVDTVVMRRQLKRSNDALHAKQAELEYVADHDALTGLFNRRQFMRLADMELARARRYPTDTHIVIADIDFFKKVNDLHGHPVGDVVLKQTADILSTGVRNTDVVARLGGEEFILLLPRTGAKEALAVAEKLRALVRKEPMVVHDVLVPVTASFGVSGLPARQIGGLQALYEAADRALYEAKRLGRDRVEYAPAPSASAPGEFAPQRTEPASAGSVAA